MSVSWAVASHPGMRRSSNEDSYCAEPELGLFVIADGMGGHVAGEVASRVAVDAIENFIRDTRDGGNVPWPVRADDRLGPDANRLKAAIHLANRRIGAVVASAADLRGMATTASAVLVIGSVAIVAHVGDSRVYLFRGGRLERLTLDHSWVEEQVRAGTMSATMAREHPWRNVVTRALSGGEDPEVDLAEVPLEPGDRLLLCSDGLFTVVGDGQIKSTLAQVPSLEEVCAALVEAANRGGGPDNITTLVLQVDAS
jgi:PPM family protein phosphatase